MSAGNWWLAIRPKTLGASLIPVLVGSAVAVSLGEHSLAVTLVCLLAALLLQVGSNLANDALDFARGVDTEDRIGPTRVTQAGLLSYHQVASGTALAFGLAMICGIYLVMVGGAPILWIGLASVVAGVAYSGGPFPLSTHGLGELAAFAFFGVVAVTGASFLHLGSFEPMAFWASIPVGALVTCLMIVNNLRDIDSDAAVGKRTLAVRLGRARTRNLYAALIALAFATPVLFALFAGDWLALLAVLSVPLALPLLGRIRSADSGPEFNSMLADTARLHGIFGLLWAVGIAL